MPNRLSKLRFWKRPKGDEESDNAGESSSQGSADTGPFVLFPLGTDADDSSAKFDIVFVHGLRGDRLATWSRGKVCWPRDLLPKDLPNARVITWGYDSMVANLLKPASQESIYGHADALLGDLSSLRQEPRHTSRPIIFVAHSLGGLVVKEALIKSDSYKNHGRHPRLASVWPNTRAVIFCGTPHRGSGRSDDVGEIIVAAAKLALRNPNSQLLGTLRTDSHILQSQRNNFTTISKDLDVVCLHEQLPVSSALGIIVPEPSATYDGFKVQTNSIRANHMDMVKFSQSDEDGYRKIVGYIRDFSKTGASAEDKEESQLQYDEILKQLDFTTTTNREDEIETADDKTCSWILSDEFRHEDGSSVPPSPLPEWFVSGRGLFWISGKPGSGKSTIMKYLHRVLEQQSSVQKWANGEPLTVAAFFLTQRGEGLQKTREGLLRSLLHQILSKDRWLIPKVFEKELQSAQSSRPLISLGWEDLQTAVAAALGFYEHGASKLLLLIDGLDEYRMFDRMDEYTEQFQDLVSFGEGDDFQSGHSQWVTDGHVDVARFLMKAEALSKVKVIFASRELTHFETAFRNIERIKVHDHTKQAILTFCRSCLGGTTTELASFISKITEKASGVFLWVKLVVGLLVQGYESGDSDEELEETLNRLPTQLGGPKGLYMSLVIDIKPEYREEASRLFQLALWAQAPIDIFHLFLAADGHTDGDRRLHALKQSPRHPHGRSPEEELSNELTRKQNRLKSRCGGLLEVDPVSFAVQFMHLTAAEFLTRKYVWEAVFEQNQTASFEPYLALLSGYIRRVKANRTILPPRRAYVKRGMEPERMVDIFRISHTVAADAHCKDTDSYELLVDELVRVYSDDEGETTADELLETPYFRHQRVCEPTLIFANWALAPPPCDDFLTCAVQLGLATYIRKKLERYNDASLAASKASSLLSSAVGVWGGYRFPSMAIVFRVIETLLRHGADPNTTTYRPQYSAEYWTEGAGAIGQLNVPSTAWIDVVEAGYSTWGPLARYHLAFRSPSRDSEDWRPRTNYCCNLGIYFAVHMGLLQEWIEIIRLMLRHGAKSEMDIEILVSDQEFESVFYFVPDSAEIFWRRLFDSATTRHLTNTFSMIQEVLSVTTHSSESAKTVDRLLAWEPEQRQWSEQRQIQKIMGNFDQNTIQHFPSSSVVFGKPFRFFVWFDQTAKWTAMWGQNTWLYNHTGRCLASSDQVWMTRFNLADD